MFGIAVGIGPDDGEPPSLIDMKDWPEIIARKILDWDSGLVPARLMIELPFWLMTPNAELTVSHDACSIVAKIHGDFVEILNGPEFRDSRRNFVQIGSLSELQSDELKQGRANISCPVWRATKTIVEFPATVLVDAVSAFNSPINDVDSVRRANEAAKYFQSLTFAHIPLLNKLITAYRAASVDPYAFEVSEWDIPVWWIKVDRSWILSNLVPYWGTDKFPATVEMGTGKETPVYVATDEEIQKQIDHEFPAGKLDILDAWSFFYRGRFAEAIRSAVTAIEVNVEAQLKTLLMDKTGSEEKVNRILNESKKSFNDRVILFERLSRRRLPGPFVDVLPWINGLRLKGELEAVRSLRHKVVHEGIRIDIFMRGTATRAVETMQWLFDWLVGEENTEKRRTNYTIYSGIRGRILLDFEYTTSGVKIIPPKTLNEDEASELLIDQQTARQFVDSISPEVNDVEHFAVMTFTKLQLPFANASPDDLNTVLPAERFYLSHRDKHSSVFCIEINGLFNLELLSLVAARSLAIRRLRGLNHGILIIVHHQRDLPARLREMELAISPDLCKAAIDCGITLITAVDLSHLVQAAESFNWPTGIIQDILFVPGRQGDKPPHYQRIGKCVRFFKKRSVLSIELEDDRRLDIGDIIAVRLSDQYHEETICEMQINGQPITTAVGPCRLGIKTILHEFCFFEGLHVFVRRDA